MSVKKYFGLAAAGVASLVATSAFAGGPEIAPAPDYSGFYIDAGVGYERSNWSNFLGGIFFPTGFAVTAGSVTSNGTGGFTWGGDVGYQFNQYFSAEVGAYALRTVTGTIATALPVAAGTASVSSWILYAAGKLSIPLYQNLDWFGKAGVAWRFLNYSGAGLAAINATNGSSFGYVFPNTHYAAPMFGTGLQYWFTQNWSMAVQYIHVPGRSTVHELSQQSPNVDIFVVTGGYKFST